MLHIQALGRNYGYPMLEVLLARWKYNINIDPSIKELVGLSEVYNEKQISKGWSSGFGRKCITSKAQKVQLVVG